MSSYVSGHGPFRGVYGRDGTRFRNRCQYLTFGAFLERQIGRQRSHGEQVRELLAPDDRAREIGRIRARRQLVAERAVGRLQPPELRARPSRSRRRSATGRRTGPDRCAPRSPRAGGVGPGRRLDDRRRPAAEVEVVGAVERPARRSGGRRTGCATGVALRGRGSAGWRSPRGATAAASGAVAGRTSAPASAIGDRIGLDELGPDEQRRGDVVAERQGDRQRRRRAGRPLEPGVVRAAANQPSRQATMTAIADGDRAGDDASAIRYV